MQRLRRIWRAVTSLRYGTDTDPRTQRLLGVTGLLAAAIVLAASAVIYVVPLGKNTYSAFLPDAGSIRAGDDVRIAGISVGEVRGLELTDDAVRMSFTVRDDVFVGDQTTLDIRMLTPIGGHYIALTPGGTERLGAEPLPAAQVRLPYSLMEAMQDARRPIAGIDGDTLRRSMSDLSAALTASPASVSTLTDALSTMVGMLDRQHRDVQQALAVADEYLAVLRDTRRVIGDMLDKIGLMETQVLARRGEVLEALRIASEFFARLAAVEPAWRTTLEPLADKLVAAVPQLQDLGARLAAVAGDLAAAADRLRGLAGPQGITVDQSGSTVQAYPICVPVPGRGC
ncbi:MlaD family protein [Nocardia cyriacigeorgica]|uniref:MCE family protein n=1 Tax=Nocardia cyriacigeorgica TaxID=135487 RepID=A0A5R8NXB8_9NOCA|nr:MlaD family protein [Nocardia cyriacigeorgica]TLF80783.1 MCE family protein [Nocardia cyriacigeorgica]